MLVTAERTRLLRTATDNAALRRALVAAGLPSVPARVALAPAPATAVEVEHLDARLAATGAGGLVTGTRATAFDGEALRHEHVGPRHRVVTTYTNTLSGHRSGPGAGAVVVDAGQDDRLAGWLGGNRAVAGAVVVRGDWVAVVTRAPR